MEMFAAACCAEPVSKGDCMRVSLRARASYTVEAVFVIPFITVLVVLMIDMTLYLRDVAAAASLAGQIAEEGRALTLNDVDPVTHRIRYERRLETSVFARWFQGTETKDAEEMTERLSKELKGRLWVCRAEDALVSIGGGKVRVQIRLSEGGAVPRMFGLTASRWFSDTITCEASCRDIRRQVRIYAAVMDIGSQVVGLSSVMEKLGSLVARFR